MKYLLFCSLVVLTTAGKNKEKRKQEKLLAKQGKLNGKSNKNKGKLNGTGITKPWTGGELIPPLPTLVTGFTEPQVPAFTKEIELRIEIPGTEELKERISGLELADAILEMADVGLEAQIYNVAVNAETVDRLLDQKVTNSVGELTETMGTNQSENVETHEQHDEELRDHKDRLDFLTEQDIKQSKGLLIAAEGLDQHEGKIADTNLELDALSRLGELAISELKKELNVFSVAGQQAIEGINGRLGGHDDNIEQLQKDAISDNEDDEETFKDHAEQLALMKQDETLDRQRISVKFQNLGKVIGEIAAHNENAIAALDWKINEDAYADEDVFEQIEEKFLEVGLEIETLDLATVAMVEGMGDSLRAVDADVQAVRKEVGENKDELENSIKNVAEDIVNLQLDVVRDMDTQRNANEDTHDSLQSDFDSMKRGAAAAHDSVYRRIEAEKNARTVADGKITEVMGGMQEEIHGLTDIDYKQEDFIEREIKIEGEIQDEVVAMNAINKRLTGEIAQMKRTNAAVHDSLGRDMGVLEEQVQEVSSSAVMSAVTAVEGKCMARSAEIETVVTARVNYLEQQLEQEQENNAVHMRKIAGLEQAQIARLQTMNDIQHKLANQEKLIQELIRLAQRPKVEIIIEEETRPMMPMEEIVIVGGQGQFQPGQFMG